MLSYKKRLVNLAKALLKNDQPEVIDAIGDIVVVLTNLAHQRGVYIEDMYTNSL
jgi:NTP pyrophosphatase (non-canonical NTP hydrolase)